MIYVTAHAITRYRQRVAMVPDAAVVAILTSDRIRRAVAFRCPSVILGTGQRVIIAYGPTSATIITIKPKGATKGSMDPSRDHPSNGPRHKRHNGKSMIGCPRNSVARCAGRLSDKMGYPQGE